jgi:hypothetical protein
VNITSYNITDVGYHYIGIRVLASLPSSSPRELQFSTVSRNVLKYASDKALRLMLPAPRGDFQAVGEKVCQELVHLGLAEAPHGKGYSLTSEGREGLRLLNGGDHLGLRRKMVDRHLRTYDNLRHVVRKQLDAAPVWSPVVDAKRYAQQDYIERLLKPTFGEEADTAASALLRSEGAGTAKKTEDIVRDAVLGRMFPNLRLSVALFRSMSDRLVTLRLLNIMKAVVAECEFSKSYSPCLSHAPRAVWYRLLAVTLPHGEPFDIYLSEPDMKDRAMHGVLLGAIRESLSVLSDQAGYFDLPQVRDFVCERLLIPEAAFDEGVNELLDLQPSPITVGLTYEGISGRRKPLVRNRQSIQVFNLIRRA